MTMHSNHRAADAPDPAKWEAIWICVALLLIVAIALWSYSSQ